MDRIANTVPKSFGLKVNNANPMRTAKQLATERSFEFDQVRKQVQAAAPDSSLRRSELLAADWKANGAKISHLVERVSALPKTNTFDSIRRRLAELDSQYQNIGSAIDGISASASPEQFLKLQKDVYQISENVGLISKMVDQLTSGVKSLLQTQI